MSGTNCKRVVTSRGRIVASDGDARSAGAKYPLCALSRSRDLSAGKMIRSFTVASEPARAFGDDAHYSLLQRRR